MSEGNTWPLLHEHVMGVYFIAAGDFHVRKMRDIASRSVPEMFKEVRLM